MSLVDMSVWVDHLRRGNRELAIALETGDVVCHEFVIGEPACGRLSARAEILNLLASARLGQLELWTRDARLRKAALGIGAARPAR